MSISFCFGICSLLAIATFLLICVPQSSVADCNIDSDLQANGPTIVYNSVDHSVKRNGKYKLSLLLHNNSSLSALFRFQRDHLKQLYHWIINDKNEDFFANFEKENENSMNDDVQCTRNDDENNSNNDDSLVRNLTTCFFPNSPKQEGVIKCNKTSHTNTNAHTLLGCTIKSCSLVRFTKKKKFPEEIEIVWVSLLPNGSETDKSLQQLEVQYNDRDLNVTSCIIESHCPVNTRPNSSTNTSSNITKGRPNAKPENDESATIVGISAGLVVTALLVATVIVGGIVWWKQRSTVKSASKSSKLSLAPTARSDIIRGGTDLPTPSPSRSEKNSPIGVGNANLASAAVMSEETGCDCYPPNSKAVVKKKENEVKISSSMDSSDGKTNSELSHESITNISQHEVDSRHDLVQNIEINDVNTYDMNDYNMLGENFRNIQNPYNTLLQPKEDPKVRVPMSTPVVATPLESVQCSVYTLASPILADSTGQPVDVIDLKLPPVGAGAVGASRESVASQYDLITYEKEGSDWSEINVSDDYDYVRSGDILSTNRPNRIPSQLQETDVFSNTYTMAKPESNPYFELEEEDGSTAYSCARALEDETYFI